jgi:hypothetical protein
MVLKTSLWCAFLALLAVPAARAHHGMGGEFDTKRTIEFAAVISSVTWANPHVRMELTEDAGKSTAKTWLIETNSVSSLSRVGITRDIAAVGAPIRVAGFPSLTSDRRLFMTHMLLPDGREVAFQDNGKSRWQGVPVGNEDRTRGKIVEADFSKRPTSIFSVWTTVYGNLGSHNTQPAASAGYPATARGLQEAAAVDMVRDHPLNDCKPKGMPVAMFAPYPVQLIKDGANIKVRLEEYDAERLIVMTSKHDDSRVAPSRLGYSTGVWEGDKLVVKTTKIDYRYLGIQTQPTPVIQGPRISTVETFQLSADHNQLNYTVVITDPDYLTKPLTVSKFWQYQPGAKVDRYNCTR